MTTTSFVRPVVAVLCALAFAGCGGGNPVGAAPQTAPNPVASAAVSTPSNAATTTNTLPIGITMAMVRQGDSLYHARSCLRCHGADAKGAANGPNLTTGKFMHMSGSYEDIVKLITNGVPRAEIKDASHQFAMNPRGGGQPLLTDDQVKAVAAYVYTLSHK